MPTPRLSLADSQKHIETYHRDLEPRMSNRSLGRGRFVSSTRPPHPALTEAQKQYFRDALGHQPGQPDIFAADGRLTSAADEQIKAIQRRFGLNPDGVIGPATLSALNTTLAPRLATTPIVPAPPAARAPDPNAPVVAGDIHSMPRAVAHLGRIYAGREYASSHGLPADAFRNIPADAIVLRDANNQIRGVLTADNNPAANGLTAQEFAQQQQQMQRLLAPT